MNKDNKLGMGLGALLSKTTDNNNDNKSLKKINISQIQPNPKQPRKNFKDNDLNELATSIKNQGLIQPVVVRELNNNQFEIVAGEEGGEHHKSPAFTKLIVLLKTIKK